MPLCHRHHRQTERRYVAGHMVDVCPSCASIARTASENTEPPSDALNMFNTLAMLDTSSTSIDFSTPDTPSTDTPSFDFGGGGDFSGGGGGSDF